MIEDKVCVVFRGDLMERSCCNDISSITLQDFEKFRGIALSAAVVIFVDDNGMTKILANRYGDRGQGIFAKAFNKMMESVG